MTQTECQNFFFFLNVLLGLQQFITDVVQLKELCVQTFTYSKYSKIQQVSDGTSCLSDKPFCIFCIHFFLYCSKKKKKKRIKLTVLCLCRSQHPLYLQYTSRFWNQAPECWASIYPVQQPVKHTHFGTLFIIRTFHRQKMFLQCF